MNDVVIMLGCIGLVLCVAVIVLDIHLRKIIVELKRINRSRQQWRKHEN